LGVSQTTALLCEGDERQRGCGEPIAMMSRDGVYVLRSAQILSYDRLGRARLFCICGAITMTRGQTTGVR
jgi:hypothetical protein